MWAGRSPPRTSKEEEPGLGQTPGRQRGRPGGGGLESCPKAVIKNKRPLIAGGFCMKGREPSRTELTLSGVRVYDPMGRQRVRS